MNHKILSVLAVLAIAFGSCTKPAPDIDNEQDTLLPDVPAAGGTENGDLPDSLTISFSTSLAASTVVKAPTTTADLLKRPGVGFGISAIATKKVPWAEMGDKIPEFMYDRHITWDGVRWIYDPVEFWPTKQKELLSFFAYGPFGAPGITLSGTEAGADLSRIDFELTEKSNETIDFVAGCQIDQTGSIDDPEVLFTLRPELTKLEMFAKVNEDVYNEEGIYNKTRIIVRSARLFGDNFYRSGQYIYNTADTEQPGSWDFSGSTPTDYPVVLNGKSYTFGTDYIAEDAVALLNKSTVYQLLAESDAETNENCIFIIPPKGEDGAAEGDINIEFIYDIVTEDDNIACGYSCTSARKHISLTPGTLKQGYSYKFTFTFHVNSITISEVTTESDNGLNDNQTEI